MQLTCDCVSELEFITNGIFNIFHLLEIVLYISNFI